MATALPPAAKGPAHLLELPPEIRGMIYEALLPDELNETCCPHAGLSPHSWCSLGFSCRHLHDEMRAFMTRRTVRLSARHDSPTLYANLPCLRGLRSFPPSRICADINPFQDRWSVPGLYKALLSTTRYLTGSPGLPRVEICVEGIMPRRTPPFCVDELDLERAPLHVVILLLPFRLLHGIGNVFISVTGGPLNDPWANCRFLTDFTKQLRRTMEASQSPDWLSAVVSAELELALQGGVIWEPLTLCQLARLGFTPSQAPGVRSVDDHVSVETQHRCEVCSNRFWARDPLLQHLSLFHHDTVSLSEEAVNSSEIGRL